MKKTLSRSRWVKVKSLDELMTHAVTRTVDCDLCGRKDCIAIVLGDPRVVEFDDLAEPAVPVTSCAIGVNHPSMIGLTSVASGSIYRLVLTEATKKG